MIFSIPSTRSKSKHCQIALCSLSTGSKVAPRSSHLLHEQRAGADQHLLVGERHDDAAPNRRQRRRQTGRADDPGHDPVGRAHAPPRPATPARWRFRSRSRRAPPSARRNRQGRRSRRSVRPGGGPARQGAPGCGWRSAPRPRTRRGCAAADRRCFARPSRSNRGSSRVASVYSAFVASAGLAAWAAPRQRQRADRPGRCRWSHRHARTL